MSTQDVFFSAATGGFYLEALHGARVLLEPDPAHVGEGEAPMMEVPNPACVIPADAVAITRERHAELLAGQEAGGRIEAGGDGYPVLIPRPAATLADLQAAAMLQIDADVDRIYDATIGSRAEEYRLAEADAQSYQAANYAGPVPPFVADYVVAKEGWTAQQAADDILATAAAWRAAQAQIRGHRLQCKELVRKAADAVGVEGALQQWAGFVQGIRQALGLAAE